MVGAPAMLLHMVLVLVARPDLDYSKRIAGLEMFAGDQAVTEADLARGLVAAAFDILHDKKGQNILTTVGFANACFLSTLLGPGSKALTAPVCSSWSWMSRYSTGRKMWRPLGFTRHHSVRKANKMVARVVLQLYLWQARSAFWILEQPARSCLEDHPRFQCFLEEHCIFRKHINMGEFGACTAKGSILYSPDQKCLDDLDYYRLPLPAAPKDALVCVKWVDGKKKVTGKPDELKISQAYPPYFGWALSDIYERNKGRLMEMALEGVALAARISSQHLAEAMLLDQPDQLDSWDDAGCREVIRYLTRA